MGLTSLQGRHSLNNHASKVKLLFWQVVRKGSLLRIYNRLQGFFVSSTSLYFFGFPTSLFDNANSVSRLPLCGPSLRRAQALRRGSTERLGSPRAIQASWELQGPQLISQCVHWAKQHSQGDKWAEIPSRVFSPSHEAWCEAVCAQRKGDPILHTLVLSMQKRHLFLICPKGLKRPTRSLGEIQSGSWVRGGEAFLRKWLDTRIMSSW